MFGEKGQPKPLAKNDQSEKDPYEQNKEIILRNAEASIGGAFEIVYLAGMDIAEDEFVLKTLQYLFPTNERMQNDPEIVAATKKIIREKMEAKGKGGDKKKNGIGKINPENVILQTGAKRNEFLLGRESEESD